MLPEIEGNVLRTERRKFSITIETPVSICFVIPQRIYAKIVVFYVLFE